MFLNCLPQSVHYLSIYLSIYLSFNIYLSDRIKWNLYMCFGLDVISGTESKNPNMKNNKLNNYFNRLKFKQTDPPK